MDQKANSENEGFFKNNIFTVTLKDDQEMEEYLENPTFIRESKGELLVNGETMRDSDIEKKHLSNSDNSGPNELKRTFMSKVFGKVDAGSIRGSIFSLAIFSLGSACLALPKKFGQMSVVVALVDILLAGFATYWTLNLTIFASEKYKIYNYSKLVKALYGRGMSLFLEIAIFLYTLGVMILYQLIAYKLIGGIVNEFGNYGYKSIDDFFENSFWSWHSVRFPIMFGTAFLIIFPLCLLKNISKMRFTSIFGIFSLFFVVVILIIQTPSYFSDYLEHIYKKDDPETHLNIFNISKGFQTPQLNFFRGTATLFYAYSCHIGAFPIYKELKNNVTRRVQKVFKRSLILDAFFYIIIGVAGYLTNPIGTPDLIIERYKIFDNDIIMTIGWIAFVLTIFTKLPANYNSLRLNFLTLIGYKEVEISNKINLIITIPTIAFTCTVASLYSNIDDYISLLGSFCSVVISFLIPGLLYIKANELPLTHYKNVLTIIFVGLLCLTGFTAGFITIYGMVI